MRLSIKPGDMSAIGDALAGIDVTLSHRGGEQAVLLNGEDVSQFLRAQEVGDMASAFSPLAPVREKLLFLQRELAERTSVIMDGRDIGTTVLPNADLKSHLCDRALAGSCRAVDRDIVNLHPKILTSVFLFSFSLRVPFPRTNLQGNRSTTPPAS